MTIIDILKQQVINKLSNKELIKHTYVLKKRKQSIYRKLIQTTVAELIMLNNQDSVIHALMSNVYSRRDICNRDKVCILYIIERCLISKHKYVLAHGVRRECHKMLIDEYFACNAISLNLIWALIHNDMYSEAVDVCRQMQKRLNYPINKEKIMFICDLLLNNDLGADRLRKEFDLDIRGKNVRIEGPLSNDDNYCACDVLLRIGYRGKQKRCDISFYNVEASNRIKSEVDITNLYKLKYAVFFKPVHRYQYKLFTDGKAAFIYTTDFIFENGQPNMLQNILFHTLSQKPNSLYLEGFNMYFSKKIYADSYRHDKNEINNVAESFAEHNIISQFLFTEALYQQKLFTCDSTLREILNNGIVAYLSGMEELIDGNNGSSNE